MSNAFGKVVKQNSQTRISDLQRRQAEGLKLIHWMEI